MCLLEAQAQAQGKRAHFIRALFLTAAGLDSWTPDLSLALEQRRVTWHGDQERNDLCPLTHLAFGSN